MTNITNDCTHCEHVWFKRINTRPQQCPNCGRRDWDKDATYKSRKKFYCHNHEMEWFDVMLNPKKECPMCVVSIEIDRQAAEILQEIVEP